MDPPYPKVSNDKNNNAKTTIFRSNNGIKTFSGKQDYSVVIHNKPNSYPGNVRSNRPNNGHPASIQKTIDSNTDSLSNAQYNTSASSTKHRTIQFLKASNPQNSSISSVSVQSSVTSQKENAQKQSFNKGFPLNSTKNSTSVLDSKDHGIFPSYIIARYIQWKSIHRIGPGFFNDGNSCYLNSTLQCLLYIPALVQVLLCEEGTVMRNVPSSHRMENKTILEIFISLVRQVWGDKIKPSGVRSQENDLIGSEIDDRAVGRFEPSFAQTNGQCRTISPRGMVGTIRRVGKQFKPLRQEDAHEYLRQLLDTLHEETLKAHKVKLSDGKKAETTAISRIFGGYLCNTMTCTRCGYKSRTLNHFQDLSLDINKGGCSSVEQAIETFMKVEVLSSGNEWYCDKCKVKVKVRVYSLKNINPLRLGGANQNDLNLWNYCALCMQATKQMTIAEAPVVLVIHLKRFSFGGQLGKITKHVQFHQNIEVKYAKDDGDSGTSAYTLTGIIVHHGHSTRSGHYVAYVKAPNGTWYEMNDSQVKTAAVSLYFSLIKIAP